MAGGRAVAAAQGLRGRRRPAFRTLILTSPPMRGADVEEAQRALGIPVDGVYGPITTGAAADWKYRVGYPLAEVDGVLTPADQRALLGRRALPDGFAARARRRARRTQPVPELAVARMERWAARGVRERPPGSDRVPALMRLARDLGLAELFRRMGFPWCALAAFLPALAAGGRTAEAGLRRGEFNALYTPAILAEARLGRFGMRVVPPESAVRGDLVLFDWSTLGDPTDHLGRLVQLPSNGIVVTVDGNTGDLVALRERPLHFVRAFVRDS